MICIGGSWHGRFVNLANPFNRSVFLPKEVPMRSMVDEPYTPNNHEHFVDFELYHQLRWCTAKGAEYEFLGSQEIPGEELLRLVEKQFKYG